MRRGSYAGEVSRPSADDRLPGHYRFSRPDDNKDRTLRESLLMVSSLERHAQGICALSELDGDNCQRSPHTAEDTRGQRTESEARENFDPR